MTIPEYDADAYEQKHGNGCKMTYTIEQVRQLNLHGPQTVMELCDEIERLQRSQMTIPDVKCRPSIPLGEMQKFTCWSCGTDFSFFLMEYNQCPKCRAITRNDEMAFIVPNEISVYLHADRHLPKATQDALKELIRCALKLLKTAQNK